MQTILKTIVTLVFSLSTVYCLAQKKDIFREKEVYKSDKLVITQISKNTFKHISFLKTQDFGNVPCNGLILRDKNEVIVFDTPTSDSSSSELIKWVGDSLHAKINAVIPTHFHNDCLAGLKVFHDANIPSYANTKTVELAEANRLVVPQNGFKDKLTLPVGNKKAIAQFLGEGHTVDNVVGYFPSENIMFGGCLLKEMNATKGYLGDANVAAWSSTVESVKKEFPNVRLIVPGHGEQGGKELLDYTINLFKVK